MAFSFDIIYGPQILFEDLIFLYLNFWIVWTILDGEMDKTKFVELDVVYNFVVDNFLFEIIYGPKILFEDLIF